MTEIPEDIWEAAFEVCRVYGPANRVNALPIAQAIHAERERIKAVLLEHEPLAGAYVHDLIRAIDGSDNDR